MLIRRHMIVLLGFLATAVPCAHANEKYILQLSLEAGQRYTQRMTMVQDNTQGSGSNAITTHQEATMDYDYEVQAVDADGIATVRATYLRVAARMGPRGSESSFDSADGTDSVPPQFQSLYALVGKSFTMRISPRGSVLSVEGLSEALEDILKDVSLEGAAREQFLSTMKQQFGDEAMKTMMEQALNIFPQNPVAIGESWTKSVSMSQMIALIMDNTWTLRSIDDQTATLEISSLIRPAEGESTLNLGGMEVNVALEGSQSGEVVLDRKTGWTLSSRATQNVHGTMSVPEGPRVPRAMSVPITMRSVVSLGPIE